MNISKRWKKFLLSTAAFFWAGCGGDSESIAPENDHWRRHSSPLRSAARLRSRLGQDYQFRQLRGQLPCRIQFQRDKSVQL